MHPSLWGPGSLGVHHSERPSNTRTPNLYDPVPLCPLTEDSEQQHRMGATQAKPVPPSGNEAGQTAKLLVDGMELEADHFFQSMRLGDASNYSLGYKICDGKLTDQEFKIHVQSVFNGTSDNIKTAVKGIFSGDWEGVTEIAVDEILPFLSGEPPKPTDTAMTEVWGKSYLIWEYGTLTNTSIYLKKTNCASIGTTTEDKTQTLLACVCRGAVDFADVDPQVLLYEVTKNLTLAGKSTDEIENVFEKVEAQLNFAVRMSELKRALEAGMLTNDARKTS